MGLLIENACWRSLINSAKKEIEKNMVDVLCMGVVMLDVVAQYLEDWPDRGGLALVDKVILQPGGVGLNVAVAVAKLGGVPVKLVGCIGNDEAGAFLLRFLDNLGMVKDGVKIDSDLPTGIILVHVHPDGERSMVASLGANVSLAGEDGQIPEMKKGDIFHISGVLGLPQFNGEPLARITSKAFKAGARVSVDTTFDPRGRWFESVAPALRYINIFQCNSLESLHLTGKDDPVSAAQMIAKQGPDIVVIKGGSEGCRVYHNGECQHIPGYRVEQVDTTGAGDAFTGGFLHGLARGLSIRDAACLANAVGACSVTATGAMSGLPTMEKAQEIMEGCADGVSLDCSKGQAS